MRILKIFIIVIISLACRQTQQEKTYTTVGIQPFGSFNKSLIDSIQNTINGIYGFRVVILPEEAMPKDAFVNIKVPRYRADWLIKYMKQNIPDSIDYIIGLTEFDISTSKKDGYGNTKEPASKYSDWGVFGLGYCPGPACIISTYRIKSSDKTLFIERIKKISIHELGHNLGLPHCDSDNCVMQDANETIKTVDKENLKLCDKCRKKIQV